MQVTLPNRRNPSIAEGDVLHHLHPMTPPSERKSESVEVLERAEGSCLFINGKRYIDALSGLGCVNIGYGNKAVCDAAYQAMLNTSYGHTFGGLTNPAASKLATKLVELTEGDFARFFFASTGSDGVESAVKLAYFYWYVRGERERRIIIGRQHAYHGNTIVAASLTGIDHYHGQFGLPLPNLVHHAQSPYPYRYANGRSDEEFGLAAARSVEDAILKIGPHKIAAFIGEPIQSTAGNIIPPDNYWAEVRRICTKYDILLICDEVICGFGKTGAMFGYQYFGYKPDLVVMAKGITSAYFPLSAVGISQAVNDVLATCTEDFEHGFTNCAHPVGAATALENIKVIEDGLVDRVRTVIGPRVEAALDRFRKYPHVGEARGVGVLVAVEFRGPGGTLEEAKALAARAAAAVYERGVIVRDLGSCIGLAMPLTITEDELDAVFNAIEDSIQAVA
jgi:putrescine---pyruvate transaminase